MHGNRMDRNDWIEQVERRGATYKEDFSAKITLIIHGDLTSKVVTDARRVYSDKLVQAALKRDRGTHICVVSGDDFADLVKGHSVSCSQ